MGIYIEEKIRVFISSIQDKNTENLEAERTYVINIVKNYSPTLPWAFEHTPASDLPPSEYFLRGVRDCHLFLILLGENVTNAVEQEYAEAIRVNKPIFAFLKNSVRSIELQKLVQDIQTRFKYANFNSLGELDTLVTSSFDDFIRRLVENDQLQKDHPHVMRLLADPGLAVKLEKYAQQLLKITKIRLDEVIIHYLKLLPTSEEASKYYIPMKVKYFNDSPVSIDEVLSKDGKVKIIGPAGSGKTTELLKLATRFAERSLKDPRAGYIPIYLDMKDWLENNIFSFIEHILKRQGFEFDQDLIRNLFENYTVILLLDGLEEISPSEVAKKVLQIQAIAKDYKTLKIIVTCRSETGSAALGFSSVYMEPLSDADIIKYLSEYSGKNFNSTKYYSWDSSFHDLMRHPLMLSFIAKINAEGQQPSSKSEVYKQYIEFLFGKWEITRGALIASFWKKRALAVLAVHMQLKSNYAISENDVVSKLSEITKHESVNFSSINLLDELVASGMLRKDGDSYTFWHASFREYFASELLIDRIRKGQTISEFVLDSAWEQVVMFTYGLIDNSSEMRKLLFEVLRDDLYLYTRCLMSPSTGLVIPVASDDSLTKIILQDMLDARSQIVSRWLPNLTNQLMPFYSHDPISNLAIVGKFSSDGGILHLLYGYSLVEKLGTKIKFLDDLPQWKPPDILFERGILEKFTHKVLSKNDISPSGAHRMALADLWNDLERVIQDKHLHEPPTLIYEQTQSEVAVLVKNKYIPGVIPIEINHFKEELRKKISGNIAILSINGRQINITDLIRRLNQLNSSGYTSIGAPLLPETDRIPKIGGWVTQFYNDQTLLEYIKLYFNYFIESYAQMVDLNFKQLAQRLNFYQLLPVRLIAEIKKPEATGQLTDLGECDYYFEPLEGGKNNEVVVVLNQKITEYTSPSSNPHEIMEIWMENLKKYGRFNSSTSVFTVRSMLSTFFSSPESIRPKVYERVSEDLRKIFNV